MIVCNLVWTKILKLLNKFDSEFKLKKQARFPKSEIPGCKILNQREAVGSDRF